MYLPLAIAWGGGIPDKEEDFVKFSLESAKFPLVKGDIEQSQLNYPSSKVLTEKNMTLVARPSFTRTTTWLLVFQGPLFSPQSKA